jgi:exodeoxyribonuclease VII small subunit
MSSPKGEKFEASLEKLEKIVHHLEEGELPLDESLKAFEEGMKLAKLCEDRLNEVQKKIEVLMKSKKTEPFETE